MHKSLDLTPGDAAALRVPVVMLRTLFQRGIIDREDVEAIVEMLHRDAGSGDAGLLQHRVAEYIEMELNG